MHTLHHLTLYQRLSREAWIRVDDICSQSMSMEDALYPRDELLMYVSEEDKLNVWNVGSIAEGHVKLFARWHASTRALVSASVIIIIIPDWWRRSGPAAVISGAKVAVPRIPAISPISASSAGRR